jgi:MFS family permease
LIASISGIYGTFIQLFSVSYLGISLTEWGLLVFISQIIRMIGTLLSGYLADKCGRLYVVFLNTVFITISYFMLFLTFLSAFLFVFLATMFIALFNSGPAIEATISERSSEANRGKIFAIFALIRDLLASLLILIAGFVYSLSPKNLIIFGLLLSLSIVFVLKIKLNHTLFPSEAVSGK